MPGHDGHHGDRTETARDRVRVEGQPPAGGQRSGAAGSVPLRGARPGPGAAHARRAAAEAEEQGVAPDVRPPRAADEEAVEAARQELATVRDQYLRLAADFDNFRKRRAQEDVERGRYASEAAVRALLPVLDNLRRAVAGLPQGADEAVVNGLRMVVKGFDDALEELGVRAIAAEGQAFDPALHEAVLAEESPEVDRDTVAAELQRGYLLHDRVLRPTLVKVVHPSHAA